MPLLSPDLSRSIWTVDALEQLPHDGNRYEILHGELLVTPPPAVGHQDAAMAISAAVYNWCRAHTGWVCHSPGGVYMDSTSWLEPDVAVYPIARNAHRHEHSHEWRQMPPPLLAVEIASPATAKTDRHRKRPAYLLHGVGEVWLVDIDARTIERWTAASEFPELVHGTITWSPVDNAPALVIAEDELFGPKTIRTSQ